MRDSALLAASFASCVVGLGWLALSMNVHWRQIHEGTLPATGTRFLLRLLGTAALLLSLLLCLAVDHASMASLVWVMSVAAAALLVAFTLTCRPRALAVLAIWATAIRDPNQV